MKTFNNQFATQKLRENTVKFNIDDSHLYSNIMNKYMRGKDLSSMKIQDEGDYLVTDEDTFQDLQAIASNLGKEDALIRQDEMQEESVTGTGAAMTPGTGEQYATTKAFKKVKKEQKDVEPKLAAGKAKVYPKEKWGWEEAPSIPNRPSKGGFIYKQLYENLNENYSRFRNETKTRTKEQQFHTAVRLAEKKILEANRILEYTAQLKGELNEVRVGKHTQKLMERITRGIAEAYGKMKKLK